MHCFHAVKLEINIRICKETGRLQQQQLLPCYNYIYIINEGKGFERTIIDNINFIIKSFFIVYIKLNETL